MKNILSIRIGINMEVNDDKLLNMSGFKNMKIWKMVIIDMVLFAISIGVFMYYDYVKPKKLGNGSVVTNLENETGKFIFSDKSVSSEETDKSTEETTKNNLVTEDSNESKINTDVLSTIVGFYNGSDFEITVTKKEMGTGSQKVTYYAADIYVSDISKVMTAFASRTYGKNYKDSISDMAEESNAVLAVNGDYYGNSEEGVVIRNGVLYRDKVNGADVCVLFKDGTMETYSPNEFDSDVVISKGAWQAWTFGPELLDNGKIKTSFNTSSYLEKSHPRTAIGYVEPGHYAIIVVDGRDVGYSKGVTLSELSEIMLDEGCATAYNLDGGKSSAMYFQGEYVNQPSDGGRQVSDIVYIG